MATLAEISCKPYWALAEACSNGGAMKELKMFPQITEETEENLLNLEEGRDKLSSTPPSCSSSSSTDTPNSPNCDSPAPCLLPIITTEDVDPPASPPPTPDEELATPPARVRMRSLSGGAHRLTPAPQDRRMRRQSGDDVLSPSRRAALFEHFRPRSKSDSKGKRPTFLTNLRHSLFSTGTPRKNSLEEPSPPPEYCRQRSGSETRGGTMSKVIELFRNRSNSVVAHADLLRSKKQSANSMPPENALLRRHSVDPVLRRRLGKPYRTLDVHQGHADDETGDSRIDYGVLEDGKIIPAFLSSHTCYSAMPKSGKVIVLTTDLLLKSAFSSLLVNEIRSAPLWDSATNSYVGILTITDFINVLRHYHYTAKEDIHAIENQQIQTWRKLTNVTKPFVKIGPGDSLADAAHLLLREGVHRVPVFDEARSLVLFVLTGRRLLQFLHQNLLDKFEASTVKTPAFMKKTIEELRIGTFDNIVTVTAETTVIEALDLFAQRKLSSLPIVDHGRLVDIFAKFDVFALAISQTYHNLNISISEALDKTEVHEDMCTCTLDETLETVIYKFVTCKVHRVVVVDDQYSPIGILSLSDVLRYLVVQASDGERDCEASVSDLIAEETASGSESGFGREHPDLSEDLALLKVDEGPPPEDGEGP